MPEFPIVDAHLHIWDPSRISYPWLERNAILNRRYDLDDFNAAFSSAAVEAMVFVQCEADFAAFREEAAWVAAQAKTDPRLKGMVAWAPLEKGKAVEEDLLALKRHPILRGIRRIIQFEDDIEFCLRPAFIEGVRILPDHGLTFDICVDHRHMGNVLKFVDALPDVPMILDHIGKPSIRTGTMEPWARQMRELAGHPNVVCKVSGVATEAGPNWTAAQLRPYIDVAFSEFGFERTLFGGDWPVTLQAVDPAGWISILDGVLEGVDPAQRRAFWRDNAARIYRLDL